MPGGRPKLFKSVKEFEDRADEYFKEKEGGRISWTGLCMAVGASSRESLQEYKRGTYDTETEKFSDSIKRALMIVENYYEENGDGAMGIFALKNFGWKDKLEINADVNQTIGELSDEELDAKIQEKMDRLSEKE